MLQLMATVEAVFEAGMELDSTKQKRQKIDAKPTMSDDTKESSPSSPQTSTSTDKHALKRRRNRKRSPKPTKFLYDLGRATLRGIRKCPQCGVFNGTRGLKCKNTACGVSLRNVSLSEKIGRKYTIEVVKLITKGSWRDGKEQKIPGETPSSGPLTFSICLIGKGATHWGFVELIPTDTAIATEDEATPLAHIDSGRCFLPTCKQCKAKQSSDNFCIHIKQALECQNHAVPVPFKRSTMENLKVAPTIKEDLWRLVTNFPGPMVQRVSRDTMVVKCHADTDHPLGRLHFTLGTAENVDVLNPVNIFQCACQVSTGGNDASVEEAVGLVDPCVLPKCCLHSYACLCAFVSSEEMTSEFERFLLYGLTGLPQNASGKLNLNEKSLEQAESGKTKELCLEESPSGPSVPSDPELWNQGVSATGLRKAGQRRTGGGLKATGNTQVFDGHTVTMGFHQWLASVTERIHQTMHFQFDGKPQPLVYHIPQEFFDTLQQRLSPGSKKKRLPNTSNAFIRRDSVPLGSFTKYTWNITNLLQVKRIFDTPQLPFEVTQSFVKNADGSYSHFCCPEPPPEPELVDRCKTERPAVIRPMEHCTFLKVGSGGPNEASPFVIEWIPDILPRCQMGELRISFEYGHLHSGQPGLKEKMSPAAKGGCNKSDSSPSKAIKAEDL